MLAAGLNITEPGSTGIGGDMFCLFYDAKTQKISALNGSGRSGNKCTLQTIRKSLGIEDGQEGKIPMTSVHSVTVPGAPAGWCDTVERFGSGKLSMDQILEPAIELGEKGFPVSELIGYYVRQRITSTMSNTDKTSGTLPSKPFVMHLPTLQRC